MTPEQVARRFHEVYEALAPNFGYETRRESALPWEEVPERNRSLMIATADVVLDEIVAGTSQETLMREAVAAATDSGRSFDAPGGEQQGKANSHSQGGC